MALIRFDATLVGFLARAKSGVPGLSQDAGAQVLVLAAEYLLDDKPMPRELAKHLAGAFKAAARRPPDERGQHLAKRLYLGSKGGRPRKGHWLKIGEAMDELMLMSPGMSQDDAAKAFLNWLDTSGAYQKARLLRYGLRLKNKDIDIDPQTIIEYWKVYKNAQKAHDDATRDD